MLTVTTSADATNLLTVEEARTFLRRPDTAEDSALELLIAAASEAIARHLGIATPEGKAGPTLARQLYVNTVPAFGDFLLQLDVWPIDTVTQVLLDGSEISDYDLDDGSVGILSREAGWPWSGTALGLDPQRVAGTEEPSVEVTCLAGYALPGQTLPATAGGIALPAQIRRAALETVKDWWLTDQRDPSVLGRNVLSPSGASAYINYQASGEPGMLPPRAVALLRPFVRVA